MLSGEHASQFSPMRYRLAIGGAAVLVAVTAAPGMLAGLSHSHDDGGSHSDGGSHDDGGHEDGGSHSDGGEHPETGAGHPHASTPPEQPEGSGSQRNQPTSGEPAPEGHSEGEPHGH